eukprot:scaffold2012_cov228-Pinguiococcus_pyrenoidosus.AAC.16
MALPQTVDEKLDAADALKETGNEFFRQQEYVKACQHYTRIFAYVNGLDTEEMQDKIPGLDSRAFGGSEVPRRSKESRVRASFSLSFGKCGWRGGGGEDPFIVYSVSLLYPSRALPFASAAYTEKRTKRTRSANCARSAF